MPIVLYGWPNPEVILWNMQYHNFFSFIDYREIQYINSSITELVVLLWQSFLHIRAFGSYPEAA